jgi:hypothetical protein
MAATSGVSLSAGIPEFAARGLSGHLGSSENSAPLDREWEPASGRRYRLEESPLGDRLPPSTLAEISAREVA